MKITGIRTEALSVPVDIEVPGVGRHRETIGCCVVQVDTDQGVSGHGLTGITHEAVVRTIVDRVLKPALIGTDALCHEARWDQMYWLLSSRGQTGYAHHAIAAVDIALWDIKGKHLAQPIWRLLGGARSSVPTYATFGFDFLERDALASAARTLVEEGQHHLKMVVGHRALQRRDDGRDPLGVIREDARRVKAVREAIGEAPSVYVDANCSLDAWHAEELARSIRDLGISFFEEPVTQNDAAAMAGLRSRCGIPLACGQNDGLAHRFRDWLVAGSVDFLQPNVVISGGYTQCARIAGLASAFNVPVTNGGAFPLHNMHLQAGVANGTKVEWHLPVVALMRTLYGRIPEPVQGRLALPEAPGLGFDLDLEAVREFAVEAG